MRLFSPRKPQLDELKRTTDIDYRRELALIGTTWEGGMEEEIAVARSIRGDSPDTGDVAEFALVVADAWQRRGLAEALLRALIAAARDTGLKRLSDLTKYDNVGMLALGRKPGFELRREASAANVTRLTLELT